MSWLMLSLRVRPHVVAATSRFLVMSFSFGTFIVSGGAMFCVWLQLLLSAVATNTHKHTQSRTTTHRHTQTRTTHTHTPKHTRSLTQQAYLISGNLRVNHALVYGAINLIVVSAALQSRLDLT